MSLAKASRELVFIGDEASLRRDDTAATFVSLVDALPPSVSSSSTLASHSESESCPKPPHSSSQHPAGGKSSSRAASHNSFKDHQELAQLARRHLRERILCAARTVSDVLHLRVHFCAVALSVADAIGVATRTWRDIAVFTTASSDATLKRMRVWVAQKPGPYGIPVPPFACADRGY